VQEARPYKHVLLSRAFPRRAGGPRHALNENFSQAKKKLILKRAHKKANMHLER
jgi:hypothetical protein